MSVGTGYADRIACRTPAEKSQGDPLQAGRSLVQEFGGE